MKIWLSSLIRLDRVLLKDHMAMLEQMVRDQLYHPHNLLSEVRSNG